VNNTQISNSRSSAFITNDQVLNEMIERPDAFERLDESDDRDFYSRPRMVEHLDDNARKRLSELIDSLVVEDKPRILDLMAAVSSHIPESVQPSELVGLGLNEDELRANKELDKYVIHDLNANTTLPFDDSSFDIVLNTVSIQYITNPAEIFSEIERILKPGGLFLVVFSNRSFPTKSVKIWELLTEDERIMLVEKIFDQEGNFESPQTYISMGQPRPKDDKYYTMGIPSDPIYAVFAQKKGDEEKLSLRAVPEETVSLPSKEEIERRKSEVAEKLDCPYCGENLHRWKITDNPWSTWDHDLYICINDACPYVIKGWQEMYRQGNTGTSYRLVYDETKDAFITIPVPNLNVIKDSIEE